MSKFIRIGTKKFAIGDILYNPNSDTYMLVNERCRLTPIPKVKVIESVLVQTIANGDLRLWQHR